MAAVGALRQAGDHRGAGGHINAGGQGFGGKHHLDQPRLKQLFHQPLPQGQNTGVVSGNAPIQRPHLASPTRVGIVGQKRINPQF